MVELAHRWLDKHQKGRGRPRPQKPRWPNVQSLLRFGFKTINNEVEYEVLLSSLKLALELQVESIEVFTDSQRVVSHINGDYEARDATMSKYLFEVKKLASCFHCFAITRMSQAQNVHADALAKLTLG